MISGGGFFLYLPIFTTSVDFTNYITEKIISLLLQIKKMMLAWREVEYKNTLELTGWPCCLSHKAEQDNTAHAEKKSAFAIERSGWVSPPSIVSRFENIIFLAEYSRTWLKFENNNGKVGDYSHGMDESKDRFVNCSWVLPPEMVKSIGVKQSMKVDKQSEASGANKSPEKIAKQPSSSESLGRSDSRGSGLTVIKNVRRIKSGLAGKEVLEIVVHKSPSNEKFDSCPIMNRSKSNENKLQNNVEKIDGIEQQKVDQGKIDSSLEEFKSALGRQSLQPETSSSNDELVEKLENIDNLGSEISLGFGETIGDLEDRSQTLIIREGPEPYLSILGTVCAYAILCPHGKIPLQKLKNRGGFWLPFVYAKESQKYSRSISLLYEFFVDEFKRWESL